MDQQQGSRIMNRMDIKKELLDLEIKLHDARIDLQSIEEIKKELTAVCKQIATLREAIK
jgi:hypothetical protein